MAPTNLQSLIVPHVKQILERHVKETDVCLELGCGPGQYRLVVPGNYIGLDITAQDYKPGFPRMVDVVADAQALPFKNVCFDVVFIVAAFYQIHDTSAVLGGVHRILKLSGRFLIFDYNYRTTKRLKRQEHKGVNSNHVWTPWGLRRKLRQGGFQAEIVDLADLYPQDPRPRWKRWLLRLGLGRWLQLLRAQLREGWNIVIGVKTVSE